MKAMVLAEYGQPLQYKDVDVPQVGNGEALVKVKVCAVDLLDYWIQSGAYPAPHLPVILGHEIAGQVVEVGIGVSSHKSGDRVIIYHHLTCGMCHWCKSGRESLCDNLVGVIGCAIDGGYAEYVKVPARNLINVPVDLSYENASIATNCVVTSFHCLKKRGQIEPLDDVLIVGIGGGVGIHSLQLAKAMGAGKVIGIDISEEKLAKATELGADHVILFQQGLAFEKQVMEITDGRGVDVAIEFAARTDTLESTWRCMATGGRMVIVGVHHGGGFKIDAPIKMMNQEIIVTGSRGSTRDEFAMALEFLASGMVKPVVYAKYSLEQANEALDMIRSYKAIGRPLLTFQ